MNTLDIILLVAVVIGSIYGFKTGLVKQLTLGAGITLGLLQATISYQQVGIWINEHSGWDSKICNILGFIAIFLAIAIIINLAGTILRWLLKAALLGGVDRISGAIFSILAGIIIVVFGVKISNNLYPDNNITGQTSQEQSLLYKEVAGFTFTIIEEVKEEVKNEMNDEVKDEIQND